MFLLINNNAGVFMDLITHKGRYQLFNVFDTALREANKLGISADPLSPLLFRTNTEPPLPGEMIQHLYRGIDVAIMRLEAK